MKNIIVLFFFATSICVVHCNAQEAVKAYAKGDDSYLQFSDAEKFDSTKQYVVLKFWNARTRLTKSEMQQLAILKAELSKLKNVQFVDVEWQSPSQLQAVLQKYNLEADASWENNIKITGDKIDLTTTSSKSLLIVKDQRAYSVCSGYDCEVKAKRFFGIGE
jgi:hypothetical protein